MFDRTIQSLDRIQKDARAFSFYATLITQIFFVFYYIGAMVLELGTVITNIFLLLLTIAALGFFLYTETPAEARPIKMHRQIRISIRYAKYCVHFVAICLAIYSIYEETAASSPFVVILLILAILALLIQIIGELLGFICRRYFEDLKAAALADTELLRSILDKVQSGADTIQRMRNGISSFSERAAEKTEKWSTGLKEKLSFFKRKKKEPPLLADVIIDAEMPQSEAAPSEE